MSLSKIADYTQRVVVIGLAGLAVWTMYGATISAISRLEKVKQLKTNEELQQIKTDAGTYVSDESSSSSPSSNT
ncbi:8804_t:CDS:2 [Paraglomus brasilianum]|uniref:8804_t:CDS:1 n=1 Tax=Paraglomus brasilianum TaxID=144538 RepID=A0A9N8ZHY1_9GLOM|nr:8804_t:CDS:2 [Paraglomus brasilianum]